MLKVKKLHPSATLPTVAHFGDLAYDLYALEDTILNEGKTTKIYTGISAQAYYSNWTMISTDGTINPQPTKVEKLCGLLIRDRSSLAYLGLTISGGVIDWGYTGEISVLMTNTREGGYKVRRGDKIAQMIPLPILTVGGVIEADDLMESSRGDAGFGSTGR